MKESFDHTTFCASDIKSGVSLAKILKEYNDDNLTKKVVFNIHSFSTRLNAIDNLNNQHYAFYALYNLHFTKNIVLNTKYPEKIKSHLLSLISTLYKRKLNKKNNINT